MHARRISAIVATGCCISLTACTLALEELKVTCSDHDACHTLNLAHGLNDAPGGDCRIYQCRKDNAGCELGQRDHDYDGFLDKRSCEGPRALDCEDEDENSFPDADEECDTRDNDCDGYIDEGKLSMEALSPKIPTPVGEAVQASFFADRGILSVALVRPTGASWHVDDNVTSDSELLAGDDCGDGIFCRFSELSVVASADLVLALGVDLANCIDGRLRVGARKRASTSILGWRGSVNAGVTSSLAAGIDAAISCGPEGRGARAPRLALSATAEDVSALGLFRAGSSAEPRTAPMAAVGLHVTMSGAIEASGNGRSELLDAPELRGNDAASIIAVAGKTPSYFAAYDSERGVELVFIPTFGTSEPLLSGVRRARVMDEIGVRRVALALASETSRSMSEPLGLAATWRVHDEGRESIRFTRLTFTPKQSPSFSLLGESLEFPREQQIVDGPVIAYTGAGFREDVEQKGGWFVAWVEGAGRRTRVVGVRIDEATGSAFDDPFVIAEDTSVDQLFVYRQPTTAASPRIGYAFLSAPGSQQLNIGSLSCAEQD